MSPVGYGFGHIPATDQYKVLRFSRRLDYDICTVGVDVHWRTIEITGLPPILFITNFVFLNGFLHWLGLTSFSCFVCYFDIEKKERLGGFPLPSHVAQGSMHLEVVDNRLYAHCKHLGEQRFWVMKDYGDFGSWTLECVIEEPIASMFEGFVRPLKMLEDGTLLIMFNGTISQTYSGKAALASYNTETRELKKIKAGFF